MSRPKNAVKYRGLSATGREQDDLRAIIADTNGNRAQRRAAQRLGITASATDRMPKLDSPEES